MADKKEEKKAGATDWDNPEVKALLWIMGVIVFLSLFLTNTGKSLFNERPVEDEETGRVVEYREEIGFPSGDIAKGDLVILKENAFVRSAPAQSILGKQEKYKTAIVQEGPFPAYDQNWWRVNFEEAPDGWVAEYSITNHVAAFRSLHIVPITWKVTRPIFWIFGGIFLVLFLAKKMQLNVLREEAVEKLKLHKPQTTSIIPTVDHITVGVEETEEIITAGDRRSNERWMHILQLLQSHNQNDWRQAIIEADIILEEMLEKMGYDGVTIGDKLKNVEPSDFRTLNQAWDAHKVRNRIAHMGSGFQISHAEAERIINLYQEVFEEFYYI